jgi:hypothetical protein
VIRLALKEFSEFYQIKNVKKVNLSESKQTYRQRSELVVVCDFFFIKKLNLDLGLGFLEILILIKSINFSQNIGDPRTLPFGIECTEAVSAYGSSTLVWMPQVYTVRIKLNVGVLPDAFLGKYGVSRV